MRKYTKKKVKSVKEIKTYSLIAKRRKAAYNRYGLKEYTSEELYAMKQIAPELFVRYQKREELIEKGLYNTYRRELFVKNLIDTLIDFKIKYKDMHLLSTNQTTTGLITEDDTIQTIIDEIKTIRLVDWDNLSDNIGIFLETYAEDIQEEYDRDQLQNILNTIRAFKANPNFKERKKFNFKYV